MLRVWQRFTPKWFKIRFAFPPVSCSSKPVTSLAERVWQWSSLEISIYFVRRVALVPSFLHCSVFQIAIFKCVVSPQSCALSFNRIDFPLSKLIEWETKNFQTVLGDLLKCFAKGENPMDDCFVERIFQIILSIAVFKDGFGSLNDIASSLALTV